MYREHFHMPDSMPGTLHKDWSPITLWGRYLLSSHFLDEGTEAQRCLLIPPRAQSQQRAESGFEARSRFQNPHSETWFCSQLGAFWFEQSLKAMGHEAWIFQPIHHSPVSHLNKWHCDPFICLNLLGVAHGVSNRFLNLSQLLPYPVRFTS